MKIDDANEIYKKYYQEQYHTFILGKATDLSLQAPAPGATPWNAKSSEIDSFSKETCFPDSSKGKVHFISKNQNNHAILWETTAKTLKEGVRWGLIKSESMTGRVISTLGHYRVIAHERIVKESNLMISNTQALKLALLDVYQDRFEVMQQLESLVNSGADKLRFKATLHEYKENLESLKKSIASKFSNLHLEKEGFDANGNPYKGMNYAELPNKLIADIDQDIKHADEYWEELNNLDSTREANRARGNRSILEFVKRQMHRNLYQFQGLNQDIVFAIGALSRGEMNAYIEDARDLIDKHKPDLRNAVIGKHHGLYASPNETLIYDFSEDDLSPAQERQALMAISFIEGWDAVDYTSDWANPVVINQSNPKAPSSAPLSKIFATKWNTHRNFTAALGNYISNWFKGIFFSTRPWEGEDREFKLYASELIRKSKPDYPLWMKAWHFMQKIGIVLKDIFIGIRNFGQQFTLYLQIDLQDDWASSKPLPAYKTSFSEANNQIKIIQSEEQKIKDELGILPLEAANDEENLRLAEADYHLSYGEEHDLLTAMVQGIGGFTGHFTHNLFAKDPVGALIYSSAFAVGGVSIFFPLIGKTFFGTQFVHGFKSFSELVGSTPLSEWICGSLTLAQGSHMTYGLMDGPSSGAVSLATTLLEDPVTSAFCFAAAYGIGYAIANVPGIGEYIRAELGSSDVLNYPVIGVKFGAGVILILVSDENGKVHSIERPYDFEKLTKIWNYLQKDPVIMKEVGTMMQRLDIVQWLCKNASCLTKLEPDTQFEIERQIEEIFSVEQARSLKKLIHPEKERSIAYQIFSVPLGYIPALFRLVFSLVLTSAAWANNNPRWKEPTKRAGEALLNKTSKDITRIFNVASNSLYVFVNVVASPFKAIALIATMLIGRTTAFADLHSGHFLHKGFAFFHDLYRRIGEALYPLRAMKSVVYADPVHTTNEVFHSMDELVEGTYNRFNQKLPLRIKLNESDLKEGDVEYVNIFKSEDASEKKEIKRGLDTVSII
ncbi:MAG: hypothetical protein H0U57_13820 [Tatlockia sp.]|nr:hypothetical protein [Tatlockia sp.]